MAIIKLSFDSYTIPVAKDGTLPVQLFGRSLNFKRITEKGIPWLICCADKDDLVEKESALASLDWVKAGVSLFPKGHEAMATSWTLPNSECSLSSCFGDKCRGPVRYQLDLEKAGAIRQSPAATPKPSVPAMPGVKPPRPKATAAKPSKPGRRREKVKPA